MLYRDSQAHQGKGGTMPQLTVNDVRLHYDERGEAGFPLVLVHGLWSSHESWTAVVPHFARSFRVVNYDRRGFGQSERPTAPVTLQADISDLAALIDALDLAPAWIVGSSEGGAIGLRLAGARPELVAGVCAHEPGFFSLLADDPAYATVLEGFRQRVSALTAKVEAGAHAEAAEQFVDGVLGPDSWAQLTSDAQQTFISSAPTFAVAMQDPERNLFDPDWVRDFARPALLTTGEQSSPLLSETLARLGVAIPGAQVVTIPKVGHGPQRTHPEAYVDLIASFIRRHTG
jgi:pimeloyl-ACP methyl ester carboxylesterase